MLSLFYCFRRVFLQVAFLSVGLLSVASYGENHHFMAGLPIHDVFPVPSGIIFPSLFTAAGVNPAALPQDKPVSGLSAAFSPSPSGGENQYSLGVASASRNFGWGINYEGIYNHSPTHGIDAGVGFRTTSASLGVAIRDSNVTSGSPQVDIGFLTDASNEVSIGLVLYKIDASPQLDVGVGFGRGKNYSFELNLLLPGISSLFKAGSNYTFTAATTVYVSIFGLSFKSSYQTFTSQVFQSVSILMYLSNKFSINLQYDSPNRTFYGITLLF